MAKVNDVHLCLKKEVKEDKQKRHEHTHTHIYPIWDSILLLSCVIKSNRNVFLF